MLILPALLAAIVTGALIPVLDGWARARGLLDLRNDRTSHSVPTPRVGGAAIVIAVFIGLAAATVNGAPRVAHAGPLAAGALAIAAMSFVDDLRPLSALLRLAGHVVVTGAVVIGVGPWPVHALL